jgi:lipopolysaccharide export LptBFGC system permease protein LptF
MEHEPAVDPAPGCLLRWIAERVASRATCERILFPLLADLQFEHSEARRPWARAFVRARGVLAFWQALGITSMVDSGRHLWANAWARAEEESRETKRLLVRVVLGAIVVTTLFLANDYSRLRFLAKEYPLLFDSAFFLLIPSIILVALPIAILFALALGPRTDHGKPSRSALGVILLAGLATLAIGAWITPVANQFHRETVFRAAAPESIGRPLSRSDREMTLGELAVRSSELRSAGRGKEAARFELEWHKKPAFGAACLALALAGAAIASTFVGRLGRTLTALGVVFVVYLLLRIGEQAADLGHLAPAFAMWGPMALVAALSWTVLVMAGRRVGPAATDR